MARRRSSLLIEVIPQGTVRIFGERNLRTRTRAKARGPGLLLRAGPIQGRRLQPKTGVLVVAAQVVRCRADFKKRYSSSPQILFGALRFPGAHLARQS